MAAHMLSLSCAGAGDFLQGYLRQILVHDIKTGQRWVPPPDKLVANLTGYFDQALDALDHASGEFVVPHQELHLFHAGVLDMARAGQLSGRCTVTDLKE